MALKQTENAKTTLQMLAALPGSMGAPELEKSEIPPSTLAALEGMTRDELMGLIRIALADQIGYLTLTKDERREAMKLRVYSIAMRSKEDSAALKAANDWLDREDGKPTQRIEQKNLNVNVSAAREMTTEQLMARLGMAGQDALSQAGVKLIEGRIERVTRED